MRIWLFILSTILLSACSHSDRQAVDKLNGKSYAYHYRDIDSTEALALKAYELAADYDAGRAEALNNLAFVNIVRMRYNDAEKQSVDNIESEKISESTITEDSKQEDNEIHTEGDDETFRRDDDDKQLEHELNEEENIHQPSVEVKEEVKTPSHFVNLK